MNIYTVLPLGLNNYLSWTPGPFSLTAVLCPDFLTPCAISGLGRNTVPDDIKSGSPCRAKEPEDVTWKCTKTSNIRKYEKRARRQTSFLCLLPSVDCSKAWFLLPPLDRPQANSLCAVYLEASGGRAEGTCRLRNSVSLRSLWGCGQQVCALSCSITGHTSSPLSSLTLPQNPICRTQYP